MKLTYLIIGALASTFYLASCEKDQIQSSDFNQTESAIGTDSTETKNQVKVTFDALPKVLKDYLVTKYKAYEIIEAVKSTDSKGLIVYKLKIKADGKIIEIKLDAAGKLVEEVKVGPTVGVITAADLPDAVKKYLTEKYPDYKFIGGNKIQTPTNTVLNIKISTAKGDIYLMFDGAGKVMQTNEIPKIAELKEANLPDAIKLYLKEKHLGYKFISARKETKVSSISYFVKIKESKGTLELLFDGNGKLINSSQNGNLETKLTAEQLIPAITTYLKTKYPTFTFVSAKKNVKGTVVSYEVTVKDASSTVELKFDAVGTMTGVSKTDVKEVTNVVKEADLSAAIKTYLTTKYAGYTFVSATSKSDDKKEMMTTVVIKKNTFTYEIKFNTKGEFVSVSSNEKTVTSTVKLTDTPADMQSYLKANYATAELGLITKSTKGDLVTYMIVVKLNNKKSELTFDAKGKFVSKKD
jgi:Putative beta-lactamase-inhibitor-like, PepSY-like